MVPSMRQGSFRHLLRIGAAAAGLLLPANGAAADVIGWIDVMPSADRLEIAGRAFGMEPSDIEYTLKVERSGGSGRSATTQSGRIQLEPGKVAKLSATTINLSPQDQLSVLLTIASGGQVLSTSEIRLGER